MGVLSKITSFLTGGVGKAATGMASDISDIMERRNPGMVKRHEMELEVHDYIAKTIADARKHDQPMNSGIAIIDALVNGINRLIRPWVTITVLGSLFGYWELPPPDSIDPEYWVIAKVVLAFWFGGRFLIKDIPQAVKSIVR